MHLLYLFFTFTLDKELLFILQIISVCLLNVNLISNIMKFSYIIIPINKIF